MRKQNTTRPRPAASIVSPQIKPTRHLSLVSSSPVTLTPEEEPTIDRYNVLSLVEGRPKAVWLHVSGDSMVDLEDGDMLLVDRAIKHAHDGDYVAIGDPEDMTVNIQQGSSLREASTAPDEAIYGVGVAIVRRLRLAKIA